MHHKCLSLFFFLVILFFISTLIVVNVICLTPGDTMKSIGDQIVIWIALIVIDIPCIFFIGSLCYVLYRYSVRHEELSRIEII